MRKHGWPSVGSLLVVFASTMGVAGSANAVEMWSMDFSGEGNDCPGVFSVGTGFSNCAVEGSPSIIKFDEGLDVDEISTGFPSIDGGEFVFSDLSDGNGTGMWTYSPDDDEDPFVKYWTAKASDGFILFWMGPDDDPANAVTATEGTWETPLDPTGAPRELSHLTFYDTEGRIPPTEIPEPLTLLLTGAGLLALGAARRRRGSR